MRYVELKLQVVSSFQYHIVLVWFALAIFLSVENWKLTHSSAVAICTWCDPDLQTPCALCNTAYWLPLLDMQTEFCSRGCICCDDFKCGAYNFYCVHVFSSQSLQYLHRAISSVCKQFIVNVGFNLCCHCSCFFFHHLYDVQQSTLTVLFYYIPGLMKTSDL